MSLGTGPMRTARAALDTQLWGRPLRTHSLQPVNLTLEQQGDELSATSAIVIQNAGRKPIKVAIAGIDRVDPRAVTLAPGASHPFEVAGGEIIERVDRGPQDALAVARISRGTYRHVFDEEVAQVSATRRSRVASRT